MRQYESYKPSGVEWIGDIPENWDVCRNIGLFDERKEINQPDMELLSVTINRGVIKQEEITEKKDSSNEDKSKYKVVRKDDLAYNKMRMWQGAIGRSEYEGIVSPAYVILSPRDTLYSRYYHYLYRTEAFIAEANRHSYGLCLDMNSLRYEDFKTIYSPVPPRTEVERIVTFLDQKTAEIDAAIAKKERLIELLNEQKIALISATTTRGLNRNATQKDSKVEWMGNIPAHWSISSLGLQAKIFAGGTPDRARSQYWGGDIPWLKTGEVNFNRINTAEECITRAGVRNSAAKIAPPDTLLMAMYGQGVTRGRVAILDTPSAFNQACVGIVFGKNITTEFGFYFFYGAYSFLRDSGNETSQMNLSSGAISKFKIAIPPESEQVAICNYLREATKTIEQAEIANKKSIETLVKLKTCLVADVVSGKCKV
jgi:type I restriction enzyme, S subunit